MGEFRVDINRRSVATRFVHGKALEEDSGLNYVDVYFPDGTQRMWGYIGREPPPGSVFAPLAGLDQALFDAIQAEIDKELGYQRDGSAAEIVPYDPDEGEEDEDDED